MTPKLIAIGGGSGSGKTYFVEKIKSFLDNSKLLVIPLDNYYRDQSHLTLDERVKQNYDHPDSLEFGLLLQHLELLKKGKSVDIPEYDFTVHTRKEKTLRVEPKELMIIEGILTLEYKNIRDLAELKLFVDTPDDIKFIRRLQRDIKERGRSVESVINQYLDTVRPMFIKYILPTKDYADIIIDGTQYNPTFTRELLERLI